MIAIPKRDITNKRVFVRNPESGEPWYYVGALEDGYDTLRGFLGTLVIGELDNLINGYEEFETLEFKLMVMTDAEVEALADC